MPDGVARGALRLPFQIKRRQHTGQVRTHLQPAHDLINQAMLQQKLRALETRRQGLLRGLLDHARTRKADEGPRLRDVEIAKGRKAGRDPTHRRMRQDRNEG